MTSKVKIQNTKLENISVFLVFSTFWIVSLLVLGTLYSGFHLFDDKGLFSIYTDLENSGFIQTFKQYIVGDNSNRFRPLYIFYRVLQVSLFGYNLYYISLASLGFAIASSFFFFKFFRYCGIQTSISVLLTFYTLVGAHASIWWRLGTNENLGVLFTSLALMLLAKSIDRQKPFLEYLSWVTLIIGSLAKESFVLFIPGFVGMSLILKYIKTSGNHTLYTLFRRELFMVVTMALVFFAELFIIFYVVENGVGYSKVNNADEGSTVLYLLKNLYLFFKSKIYFFAYFLLNFFVLFFGLFLNLQNLASYKNKKFIIFCLGILNFFVIFVPQFLLHAGLGFTERYLIPLHFSFTLLFLIIIVLMNNSGEVNRFSKNTFNGLLLLSTIFFFFSGFVTYAKDFTTHGKAVTSMFGEIRNNTDIKELVVILDKNKNVEHGFSVNTYLTFYDPTKRVYSKDISEGKIQGLTQLEDLFSDIELYEPFYGVDGMKDLVATDTPVVFDAIVILPDRNKNEIPINASIFTDFNEYLFDPYTLYLRKGIDNSGDR